MVEASDPRGTQGEARRKKAAARGIRASRSQIRGAGAQAGAAQERAAAIVEARKRAEGRSQEKGQ